MQMGVYVTLFAYVYMYEMLYVWKCLCVYVCIMWVILDNNTCMWMHKYMYIQILVYLIIHV